jgi:hypothetical protein
MVNQWSMIVVVVVVVVVGARQETGQDRHGTIELLELYTTTV